VPKNIKGKPIGKTGEYLSSIFKVVGCPGIPGLLLAKRQLGKVVGLFTA
jgi:hypothetical protein